MNGLEPGDGYGVDPLTGERYLRVTITDGQRQPGPAGSSPLLLLAVAAVALWWLAHNRLRL